MRKVKRTPKIFTILGVKFRVSVRDVCSRKILVKKPNTFYHRVHQPNTESYFYWIKQSIVVLSIFYTVTKGK